MWSAGSLTLLSPFGHVILAGDTVATSGALTHVPGALVAREICNFLATLAAASPGSGKTFECLLKENATVRDMAREGGASPRLLFAKDMSNKCSNKKSDST